MLRLIRAYHRGEYDQVSDDARVDHCSLELSGGHI